MLAATGVVRAAAPTSVAPLRKLRRPTLGDWLRFDMASSRGFIPDFLTVPIRRQVARRVWSASRWGQVRQGSISSDPSCAEDFRFSPTSRHFQGPSACLEDTNIRHAAIASRLKWEISAAHAKAGAQFLDDGHEEIRRSYIAGEDCREQPPQRAFPAYHAASQAKV